MKVAWRRAFGIGLGRPAPPPLPRGPAVDGYFDFISLGSLERRRFGGRTEASVAFLVFLVLEFMMGHWDYCASDSDLNGPGP